MMYIHQQDLHKQPVYCNMPYAIVLPYSKDSQKAESPYLIAPDIMSFLPPRGRLGHSHYVFV